MKALSWIMGLFFSLIVWVVLIWSAVSFFFPGGSK